MFSTQSVTSSWALSHATMSQSGVVLILHIFAHGGIVHVVLNAAALFVVGPRLIARIGSPPMAYARFLYVFLGSGISGGGAFLLLNSAPQASAIGASGAIFGIIGALARVHPATGVAVSLLSRRSWLLIKMFVRDHLIMLALIFGALIMTGHSAMVAWEAHLGGMLFGLFIAPLFLPGPEASGSSQRPSS
jgi:membrane associated rhomboid family serine protease